MANRRPFRRPFRRVSPPRSRGPAVAWRSGTVPRAAAAIELRTAALRDSHQAPVAGQAVWELVCRDGWEWTRDAAGHYRVRIATLTDTQADVVRDWIERLTAPATWWAVSRELSVPDSEPDVAVAIADHPWLTALLPSLLEASTEGAPPPPADADS